MAPVQPEYAEARRKDAQVDQALETLLGPLPRPGHELDDLAPDPYADETPDPTAAAGSEIPAQDCTTAQSPRVSEKGSSQPNVQPETLHNPAQACTTPRSQPGRNEACFCGSGLKYKRCCLGKSAMGQAA